ncbi:MAG: hypothetical protein ABII76_24710 [Pseudomonadota bacterium]
MEYSKVTCKSGREYEVRTGDVLLGEVVKLAKLILSAQAKGDGELTPEIILDHLGEVLTVGVRGVTPESAEELPIPDALELAPPLVRWLGGLPFDSLAETIKNLRPLAAAIPAAGGAGSSPDSATNTGGDARR